MKLFKISVEWKDGTVTEEVVTEKMWFSIVYPALEASEEVEQYGVDTIK